jgi:hypothetical protein
MWFMLAIGFLALMCDRAGPIRGLWIILDGKIESGLMLDSEL